MTEQTPEPQIEESNWRKFLRNHWSAFATFTAAAIVAFAVAVYVFVWFTGNAQATGLVPSTLNMWSMANILTFVVYAILWVLAIVGIPAAITGIAAWQWWKRMPETERAPLGTGKKSKSRQAGGAISPLFTLAFAIKIYLDGNWNQAIASWSLDYVIGSMVTILLWTVAIFSIPAIIGVVWWLSRGKKA